MQRREFITLLGGAAVLWPVAARAQPAERMRRIGVLSVVAEGDPDLPARVTAFRQELGKFGWTEGRNVRIEFRLGAGDPERMRTYARELRGVTPDVVVAESTLAAASMLRESSTIPVVFVQVADPVGSRFVESMARPGGNATGFTNFEPSFAGKWLELLTTIAPRTVRVAGLFNPDTHSGQYWSTIETTAPLFAVTFSRTPAHDAAEIERAVEAFARQSDGALLVLPDPFTIAHRELIITLAKRHSLPAIYSFRVFATSGGLISYGIDIVDEFRHAALYVDRILRGAKPSDLPVQAPTRFELIINSNTAKALGLQIPDKLIALADEVIE